LIRFTILNKPQPKLSNRIESNRKMVSMKEFTIQKKLGEGAFSSVF